MPFRMTNKNRNESKWEFRFFLVSQYEYVDFVSDTKALHRILYTSSSIYDAIFSFQ